MKDRNVTLLLTWVMEISHSGMKVGMSTKLVVKGGMGNGGMGKVEKGENE